MIPAKLQKLNFCDIRLLGEAKRLSDGLVAGLSGNIQKYFKDLSEDSAWLYGNGEAWERGPYYLDGIVPLAYLSGDEALLKTAKRWVESILSKQDETGFFGVKSNTDWWPRIVAAKALTGYFYAEQDGRVIEFLDKFLYCMYTDLDKYPLYFWAAARGFDLVEPIELVYKHTGKAYLNELLEKIREYSYDWFSYFENFRYIKPTSKYLNKKLINLSRPIAQIIDKFAKKHGENHRKTADETKKFNNNRITKTLMLTHGVNIAMALKYPVTYGSLSGKVNIIPLSEKGFSDILKYHGNALAYSSDEHLDGVGADKGVELCTVAELMYSFEEMLRFTGDTKYADNIEKLVYNILPSMFSPDFCSHQYLAQPNQYKAAVCKMDFYDVGRDANTYGIAPNFGCCAANMHQAFPKFFTNSALKDDGGAYFYLYADARFKFKFDDGIIEISENTNYPFGNTVNFYVSENSALSPKLLHFRVPEHCSAKLLIDGKLFSEYAERGLYSIEIPKKGGKITIEFSAEYRIEKNPDGSVSVRRGTLLFALPIKEKEKYIKGERPFHDREYLPGSEWNFAPVIENGKVAVTEEIFNGTPPSDSAPPVSIKVKAAVISNFGNRKNVVRIPKYSKISGYTVITLVSFGSTRLRISQFPKIIRTKINIE